MTDFNELVPELARWNDGNGISIDSWINGIGNFEHAIAYGHFFWPEFIEHDGCIFRKNVWNLQNYQAWLTKTRGDKTAIERVMNHLHLSDLYPNAAESTTAQKLYLAGLLKEIWECKLKRDFPDLEIQVELVECENNGEDWSDCQITISRRRNAPPASRQRQPLGATTQNVS